MEDQVGELGFAKVQFQKVAVPNDFAMRLYIYYHRILDQTEIGKEVLRTLTSDARVQALEGAMLLRGNGSHLFDVGNLAMWFLWCANEYGREEATRNLEEFL